MTWDCYCIHLNGARPCIRIIMIISKNAKEEQHFSQSTHSSARLGWFLCVSAPPSASVSSSSLEPCVCSPPPAPEAAVPSHNISLLSLPPAYPSSSSVPSPAIHRQHAACSPKRGTCSRTVPGASGRPFRRFESSVRWEQSPVRLLVWTAPACDPTLLCPAVPDAPRSADGILLSPMYRIAPLEGRRGDLVDTRTCFALFLSSPTQESHSQNSTIPSLEYPQP